MKKIDSGVLNEARILIAKRLKERRLQLGITQQDLSEMTELGIATIKRFEAGKFWPGLKIFLIICYALDCYFFIEEKEGDSEYAILMRERWGKISKN